ncbi:MAG: hypothetical protein EB064_02070 [Betaproteobacteria bacterium]|nr:hypothetical protein [Betaproteobacteria bacterium]
MLELQPPVFFGQHKVKGLVGVVVAVKLPHPVNSSLLVVAVLGAARHRRQQARGGQGFWHKLSSGLDYWPAWALADDVNRPEYLFL